MKIVVLCSLFIGFGWCYQIPKDAGVCSDSVCTIDNNCRCSSTTNPIQNDTDPSPQFIAFTVSESVVKDTYESYWKPLFFERKNSDGGDIGVTFYVNHEYTDYDLVNDLYNRGYEIGDHSVTKNSNQSYWRNASLDTLTQEFQEQRTIISTFASIIPGDDIVGVRTPQLQLQGDVSFQAYTQASGLSYDNSWPTSVSKRFFPYTLDYKSTQDCLVSIRCPTSSFPGFWVVPLTNIQGQDKECNSLATCDIEGSAQEISDWLVGQVDLVQKENRAPIVLRVDSYWFKNTENSFEGFSQFLDEMGKRSDVFLVNVKEVINWMKNPVPLSNYKSPEITNYAECYPATCKLKLNGEDRNMGSCIPCPCEYPWLGNPSGECRY